MQQRLVSEARAAAEIGHATVVKVYDVGVTPEGIAYLVSEPLRGETIADILGRQGALQNDDACRVTLALWSGLEVGARRGVTHGTLDADSVILRRGADEQLIVKILDFRMEAACVSDAFPPSGAGRTEMRSREHETKAVAPMILRRSRSFTEMLSGRPACRR